MNFLRGSKHCWNQHGTTITLFSRQLEVNWIMCMKFRAFSKKDEYPSLIISEIIDAERRGYLNV